jgi:hypothetical protein
MVGGGTPRCRGVLFCAAGEKVAEIDGMNEVEPFDGRQDSTVIFFRDEKGKLRLHHEVVHLSSPAPGSVNRAYHKIRGWVKRNTPTPIS